METMERKVALVTGGGQGLGEAICKKLCSQGITVVLADIRMDLAERTASELESAGNQGMPVQLDVSDERQVQETIGKVVGEFGRLDILINNAGTDKTLSIEELSIQDWDRVLAVNLRGPFLTSKAVLPVMRRQGSGYIINIVSTAAKRAWANASAYHASKWGLLGFSHALHVEARQHNVKVTALVAGGMRTPFLLDRFPDINIENLQDPKNVAEVIAFLLNTPDGTVIPELMVIPMGETSWP
jgi:NAD(P)-dependent dehydrogenase (short-subunit alcohol dehydrogenase family)